MNTIAACRYLDVYTYALPARIGTPNANVTRPAGVHICSFCGGAAQYVTSESGGRKARR